MDVTTHSSGLLETPWVPDRLCAQPAAPYHRITRPRWCGVVSHASAADVGLGQYDMVVVVSLEDERLASVVPVFVRHPQVGDGGTIVEVDSQPQPGYEVECVDSATGGTLWLEALSAEIAPRSLRAPPVYRSLPREILDEAPKPCWHLADWH